MVHWRVLFGGYVFVFRLVLITLHFHYHFPLFTICFALCMVTTGNRLSLLW